DIAVLNQVRNDHAAEMSHELADPVREGELIINLRAETDPEMLHGFVSGAIEKVVGSYPGWAYEIVHEEHFRPGKPEPTHRFAEALSRMTKFEIRMTSQIRMKKF